MNSVLFGVLLGGGHARAVLATSLLHIHAHLHLVDDRDEDGHHISVSGRGIVRPPDTVESTHRTTPDDLQQRPRACSDHVRATGSKRTLSGRVRTRCDEVVRRHMPQSRYPQMHHSMQIDILERQGLNRSHTATANFVLLILQRFWAQTPRSPRSSEFGAQSSVDW